MLVNWFNALDVDQSGTIDASEIRQMMTSIGVKLTPAQLARMFTSIGKQLDQPLEAHDFVRLMHLLGGSVHFVCRMVPAASVPPPFAFRRTALSDSRRRSSFPTDLGLLDSSSAACRIPLACAAWPLPLRISRKRFVSSSLKRLCQQSQKAAPLRARGSTARCRPVLAAGTRRRLEEHLEHRTLYDAIPAAARPHRHSAAGAPGGVRLARGVSEAVCGAPDETSRARAPEDGGAQHGVGQRRR